MKSISNFHTHTELCHHAKGQPVDYVNQAMKEGCSALGFSDHCPYPEDFFDCWPEIRMTTKEASGYSEWIKEAKKNAAFPIRAMNVNGKNPSTAGMTSLRRILERTIWSLARTGLQTAQAIFIFPMLKAPLF